MRSWCLRPRAGEEGGEARLRGGEQAGEQCSRGSESHILRVEFIRSRAISRASGCKISALDKSLGPRGMYFPIHPSSLQCKDTILVTTIWMKKHNENLTGTLLEGELPIRTVIDLECFVGYPQCSLEDCLGIKCLNL